MADTFVSYTDLLASAVEQRDRDKIYSRRMYYAAQKTTDTSTDCTNPVEINLAGVKNASSGLTVGTTDITVPTGGDGVYFFEFSAEITGTNGQDVSIVLNVSDVSSGWINDIQITTADITQTLTLKGIVTLAEAAILNLVIDEAANGTITIDNWNLLIVRLD